MGAKNAYDVVHKTYIQVKDVEGERLNGADKVLKDAKNSHELILKLSTEAKTWKADVWVEQKRHAEQVTKEYQENFSAMMDYYPTLQAMVIQKKQNADVESRSARTARDRIANQICKLGCPKPLAQLISVELERRPGIERYKGFFVDSGGSSSAPQGEFATIGDFANPKGFLDGRCPTHWHRELKKALQENDAATTVKLGKAKAAFEKPDNLNATHLGSTLGAYAFAFNPSDDDGGSKPFLLKEEAFSPMMMTQKAWGYSTKIEAVPYGGMPGFLSCVHGCMFIVCVPIRNVVDNGKSLETVHQYLEGVDKAYLGNQFAICITKGQSMWCAAGFIPFVIGVGASPSASSGGETTDGDAQGIEVSEAAYSHCAYVFHPCPDQACMANVCSGVRAELLSWFAKGRTRCKNIFNKANLAALDTWLNSWPEVVGEGITVDG